MNPKKISDKDWKIVQELGKVVSDWGGHKAINDAIIYFKNNPKARKIVLKMADVENKIAEQATEELRELFFKLKQVLLEK
jgi:hypothetical protein